jgi:Domain of unknown function (DUF4234)
MTDEGLPGHTDAPPDPLLTPGPMLPAVMQAPPASADIVQTVTAVDRSVKARRDVDVALINWWLYFLLVAPFTLGIYAIVMFFKRINRIDGFSARKIGYYNAVLDWTERHAAAAGRSDTVHHDVADLRAEVQAARGGALKPIKAGRAFLLSIVTLGIYYWVLLHRLNRYWWEAQVLEQEFDDKLSQAWSKLDIMRYPLTFSLDQSKRRSYPLYFILSIVTLGIWGLVWDNKIHKDPDTLYGGFHTVEDMVLQTVRAY